MMLNNKGQTLVLFILLLPILIIILSSVVDINNLIYNKQDLDNINKIAIDYALDNIEDESVVNNTEKLIRLNNDKIKTSIKFNDLEIYISSTYYVEGIFSKILNKQGFLIQSNYKGYLDDYNKKIIKRIKQR